MIDLIHIHDILDLVLKHKDKLPVKLSPLAIKSAEEFASMVSRCYIAGCNVTHDLGKTTYNE
jgi:hypothetical protein